MGMNFDDLYLGSFVGIRADGMTRNVVGMRPTRACYKRAEMVGSFLLFTFSLCGTCEWSPRYRVQVELS